MHIIERKETMTEEKEIEIQEIEGDKKKEALVKDKGLYFRKREAELDQRYLKGDELLDMQEYINNHIYFYRQFVPFFDVRPGEIYYADFPVGFGAEIHGKHPVVVLHRSPCKNPMITVVPLTSGSCHEMSDVDLGIIEGLAKGSKHSVAVINQTRSIDKRRIVPEYAIKILREREATEPIEPSTRTKVCSVKVRRLEPRKFTLLRRKVDWYINDNNINKDK